MIPTDAALDATSTVPSTATSALENAEMTSPSTMCAKAKNRIIPTALLIFILSALRTLATCDDHVADYCRGPPKALVMSEFLIPIYHEF